MCNNENPNDYTKNIILFTLGGCGGLEKLNKGR